MSEDFKKKYYEKNLGDFPANFNFLNINYSKVDDLRYGTNPNQPAAIYKPDFKDLVIGEYNILKSGKNGFSLTNLEDVDYAVNILKYFTNKSVCIMKHLNPCGFCCGKDEDSISHVLEKAYTGDPQAAFGGVVVCNKLVDEDFADIIMQNIVEVLAAPDFTEKALEILNNSDKYKKNKNIRIIKLNNVDKLPRYEDDPVKSYKIKILSDGSLVFEKPFLTKIKSVEDLVYPTVEHKTKGIVKAGNKATDQQLQDLLTSWYINIGVRSNGVVIVKEGVLLSAGTGEQDRVGAVEQAIIKAKKKYKGDLTLEGSVLSSDGFFPFPDSIELLHNAGISAVVEPGGSVKDYDVIETANKHNIAILFSGERCFSHH